MRYFAPLNVVIQQGDIFSQNAEVVKFLSSSPGRTGLEEEVQVLFTPTEKIENQEGVGVDKSPELQVSTCLS